MTDANLQGKRRFRRKGAYAAAVLILGAAFAYFLWGKRDPTRPCRLAELVQPGSAKGYHVLLVTLDTTRPDHLGTYGYEPAATPSIDSLVRAGVRFDDAVVSAPLTLPSHATIHTGLYPYRHGVRTNVGYKLSADATTLAERFKSDGYQTAAFVSCFVLDKRFGLDQGFDAYDFSVSQAGYRGPNSVFSERFAADVTDATLDWLTNKRIGDKPFFVWLHYYDPHDPYESPLAKSGSFKGLPYDAEIAAVDQEFGRILAWLDEAGVRKNTLIALATDHGESLGAHDEEHHGIFIYEATVHAGLILSNPTLFGGAFRVDDRVVGLVDLAPTLLELTGLPELPSVDGRSLLESDPRADRTIYVESEYPREGRGCSPLYGLRSHTAKYIFAPKPEFYDLSRDRAEQRNLFADNPPALSSMKDALAAIMKEWPAGGARSAGAAALSAEDLARLASLGYVGGAAPAAEGSLPDPKDQMALVNELKHAVRLGEKGQLEEALKIAQAVAERTEGYDTPIHTIAHLYEAMGRWNDAVDTLEDYARKHPSSNLYLHLAKDLYTLKRYDEYENALKAAEVIEPLRGTIPQMRGDHFFSQGRYAEAAAEYERALEIDPYRIGPEVKDKLEQARWRERG